MNSLVRGNKVCLISSSKAKNRLVLSKFQRHVDY